MAKSKQHCQSIFPHSRKKRHTFPLLFCSFQFTFLIFPKGERIKYIRDISTLFSVIILCVFRLFRVVNSILNENKTKRKSQKTEKFHLLKQVNFWEDIFGYVIDTSETTITETLNEVLNDESFFFWYTIIA